MSVIKDGWSWDTFMNVMGQYRAYLDSKGKADWYCCDANLTTWLSCNYPILRSYGADVLTKDGKIAIDSAETRECLTMVRRTTTYIVILHFHIVHMNGERPYIQHNNKSCLLIPLLVFLQKDKHLNLPKKP